MKRFTIALAAALLGNAAHAAPPADVGPQMKSAKDPLVRPLPLTQLKGCPDLGIKDVRVHSVRRGAGGTKRINFSVKVRNDGSLDYKTRAAAAFTAYARAPGSRTTETLATRSIGVLRKGGSFTQITGFIPWSTSTEFPPSVVAEIHYEPDFASDGSRNNDDCQMNNNRFELPGDAIHRQVRAMQLRPLAPVYRP